jgi:hypothetical protein
MTPTREQFKEFIAAVQKAQQKEDNLNKALELIWDDDQGQYPPFYISPLWDAIYKAFNFMFGLEDDEYVGNELSWWLEEAPLNEAKYWVDDKDYNVSDVDAFYDFLVEFLKKKKTETNNE